MRIGEAGIQRRPGNLLAHETETRQEEDRLFQGWPMFPYADPSFHESEGSTGSGSVMLRVQHVQDRDPSVTVVRLAAIETVGNIGQTRLKPSLLHGFAPYLATIHYTEQ